MAFHRRVCPATIPQRQTSNPQFLSGWKDIATYLRKGVRTVQRYERELELPVRRPAGRDFGSVIATRLELDRWASQNRIRPHHRNGSDSKQLRGVKKAAFESFRLCAEALKLTEALTTQSRAVSLGIDRVGQAVSDPRFCQAMEMHKMIAAQQEKRAKDMIEAAHDMSARAIETRKESNRRLIANF